MSTICDCGEQLLVKNLPRHLASEGHRTRIQERRLRDAKRIVEVRDFVPEVNAVVTNAVDGEHNNAMDVEQPIRPAFDSSSEDLEPEVRSRYDMSVEDELEPPFPNPENIVPPICNDPIPYDNNYAFDDVLYRSRILNEASLHRQHSDDIENAHVLAWRQFCEKNQRRCSRNASCDAQTWI